MVAVDQIVGNLKSQICNLKLPMPKIPRDLADRLFKPYPAGMVEKSFAKWWLGRVMPFRDVPVEKLTAEREAISKQKEYNQNYRDFLDGAVLPAVDGISQLMVKQRIVHRVSTWGNQLSIRVHLAWRWGEMVITQSHEDAVTFEHHIITEGEKRGDDSAEDHTHQYDLRDPLPAAVAEQEIQFFLSRLAQDLVEMDAEPEIPPGEEPG
jgi:hypothetical protein